MPVVEKFKFTLLIYKIIIITLIKTHLSINSILSVMCLFGFSKDNTYQLWPGLLKKKLSSLDFTE